MSCPDAAPTLIAKVNMSSNHLAFAYSGRRCAQAFRIVSHGIFKGCPLSDPDDACLASAAAVATRSATD
eukprot:1880172-Pyramimonas_sp.AAC.1